MKHNRNHFLTINIFNYTSRYTKLEKVIEILNTFYILQVYS